MNFFMLKNSFSFHNFNLHHVFNVASTRSWQSINPFTSYKAIQRIAEGLNIPQKEEQIAKRIVFAEQVHEGNVHICNPGDEGSIRLGVDALISNVPSQILGIYTSDCIPLILYDPQNRVIGAVHAGYKSLAKGIISNCVESFNSSFNSPPANIIVGIEPFIHVCCYEIREDILGFIDNLNWLIYVNKKSNQMFLDLNAILYEQLTACGILSSNIENMEMCTACRSDIFFSARKRKPDDERGAAMISLISLNNDIL